jgi:hypothetical protein
VKRLVEKARKRRRSEHAYVLDAHKRLKAMGILSRREAPLMGRSIDLVFLKNGSLFSVEFKLRDWRKALGQARDHQIGSDYSYICLPRGNHSPELQNEVKRAGVGLFIFVEDAEWPFITVVDATPSAITSPFARDSLSTLLISVRRIHG